MVATVGDVRLSLPEVSQQSVSERVAAGQLFELTCFGECGWAFELCLFFEQLYGGVADLLVDYEVVLANLFIGVVFLVLLREVDSHAAQ